MSQSSRSTKGATAFAYKIGGVSAKYYVVLFVLLFGIYVLLPLPAAYYNGDTFFIVAFAVIAITSAGAGVVGRIRRRRHP